MSLKQAGLKSAHCFQELIQTVQRYFDSHGADILLQTKQMPVNLWWATVILIGVTGLLESFLLALRIHLKLWEELCYLTTCFCFQRDFLDLIGHVLISQGSKGTHPLSLMIHPVEFRRYTAPPSWWSKLSYQMGKTIEDTNKYTADFKSRPQKDTGHAFQICFSQTGEPMWETNLDGSKGWRSQCKKHLDWGSINGEMRSQ